MRIRKTTSSRITLGVATAAFTTIATIATSAVASTATAAPVEKVHFYDAGSELTDFCGFDVLHTWDISGHVVVTVRHGQLYYREQSAGTSVWTIPDTGRAFTGVFATSTKDREVADNGNGTLTITVQGAGSAKWYDADGQLVLKNPGMSQWQILIDHGGTLLDPSDDEFVEFLGVVRPSTGRNDNAGHDFCEDILAFTA